MIKHLRYFTLVLLSMFVLSPQDALAAKQTVKCEFSWEENVEKNVKGSNNWGDSLKVRKCVRQREYDRLIEAGKVAARVSGKRGTDCYLNHPENTTIDTKIYKSLLRSDIEGRMPTCQDLFATVECKGGGRLTCR